MLCQTAFGSKGRGRKYNPAKIEKFWQKFWRREKIFEPDLKKAKQPFYNLMMFPYPSAEGLHVGNMYAFVGSDIYGRFKKMQGFDVFEPIGLDGFGIHSENYALKVGKHPMEMAKITERHFYQQLKATGNAYAWSKKLETYDPDY
ncbi:MAG: class I tRNA ligase family protein, partial [Candidatus Paceibacteria bacterium]